MTDDVQAPHSAAREGHVWWKHGVIYQVYPRSFQDTDDDGVGDLAGVIARLDYLVELGVDAIWLSPIFRSPMVDFGYDVADYTAIDPLFGDLPTFRELIAQAHGRGIKVILDYVLNHTSDQHPWFLESRQGRDSPRRDWYIWSDPGPGGGPPNNWRSEFGGSSWTWDQASGQYYYHAFLPAQPDLNWRNRDVVEAMMQVLKFWLDLGVDGFRVDAVHHLFESEDLADNPPDLDWREGMPPAYQLLRIHTVDLPEVHEAIAAMRRLADAYDDRVLIGEAYLPIERLVAYYGGALDGFHLPFNFHLISTPWTPGAIAGLAADYEAKLPRGGWPNWVLGNHDRSRIASRVGPAQARVAALLLLTLRGTPTLYQGDELGLPDGVIARDQVKDPWEKNVPGQGFGRDPVRTPMPWTSSANAGFSKVEPWLPLTPDWRAMCVERQRTQLDSMLGLYRAMLALRRSEPALSDGAYALVTATDSLLAYERVSGADRFLIVLDLLGLGGTIDIPAARIAMSTLQSRRGESLPAGALRVEPDQGYVLKIEP